ncbi:MAG: DUF2344 domain-containing protein [Spirochaetales bacterium]|nr:DUF2344 domain-containing protein [Spirochaetales bacterium]
MPFQPEPKFLSFEQLAPLLQQVERPGRYTGGEFGIPQCDPVSARARILLSYPDTYELGMSNEGLKILYDVVMRHGDFFADRAYLPWTDMGSLMQQAGVKLYSLGHYLLASSFDVWGFNVAHELHFSNILYALDLAGLPLLRRDRNQSEPIVIVGGTAVTNPLSLYDFVDAVFLGDGEQAILEILTIVARCKEEGKDRSTILNELASVSGLLVFNGVQITHPGDPGHYPQYQTVAVQKRTHRAPVFADLKHAIVPSIAVTQDRVVVEVTRGCGQACRFCHAGFWKRPVRNSEVDALVQTADRLLAMTGNDSVSLHALSIADYPWLEELVVAMAGKFGPQGISISLPSLRVQVKTIPVLEMTAGIRRSSVTFALEAGSELQRERIHKKSSEENLHYLIREVFSRKWDLVKVYFMLGLPDLEGTEVEDLIRSLNALGRIAEESGQRKNVNVSVSLFVPKPFTTFQWEKQQLPDFFASGIARIKAGLKSRRVHLKYPDPWMAYVEGFLSRGDHRVGAYLAQAYHRGARFCSWDNAFARSIWQDVLSHVPESLLQLWLGERAGGTYVPWHSLVDGFPLEKLVRDYEKYRGVNKENMNPPHPQALSNSEFPEDLLRPVEMPAYKFQTVILLKLVLGKSHPMQYVGHLEFMTALRKALRRARWPLSFSQGFNKHEKLHFDRPVPLYMLSRNEIVICELYEAMDPVLARELLEQQIPPGMELLSIEKVDHARMTVVPEETYQLAFHDEVCKQNTLRALESLPRTGSFYHRKKKSMRERFLQEAIVSCEDPGRSIQITLRTGKEFASIQELLSSAGLPVERWNVDVTVTKWGPAYSEPPLTLQAASAAGL